MKSGRRDLQIYALFALILSQAFISGAQTVTNIAAGNAHNLFLKSDGGLWGMGSDIYGELGDGTNYLDVYRNFGTNRPEQIVSSNVTTMAGGGGHTLFLKSDGSLWVMGENDYGELGDNTYINTNRPEQILASNVTAIAAGYRHNLLIKSDGSLWAMGNDAFGQLGDGISYPSFDDQNGTNQPEQIVASNVVTIAAGFLHSLFIKSDGSLWAMGDDYYGELGDGAYGVINQLHYTNQPEQIVASNVVAIAGGNGFSLFLKRDGSLWATGNNQDFESQNYVGGQLGDGTYNSTTNLPEQIVANNVVAIAAGYYHSLFIKNDGSLWAMGDNSWGELGDGTYNSTNRPEQIVASGVIAIAAGYDDSLFLKNDGSLWAMGFNQSGELGDGIIYIPITPGINIPEQILAPYNQIFGQRLTNGQIQLSFVGIPTANYALDDSTSLSPANWIPVATNPATSYGTLIFTNTPDSTINHFWRIRSVP
jgi:alpha-tubulin suppressor-like RCC1 family protein